MQSFNPGADERAAVVRRYRPIGELIPAHWGSGYLEANGIRQRYLRTGGGGPPLLLLHGIMEGALSWLPTARALEAEYDVVMLDARGHGGSVPAGGDLSPETLADDAAGAIAALGLEELRLLGFSMGASTAALLADRHPGRLRALILAGMPEPAPAEGAAPTGNPMESPGYRAWLEAYQGWLAALPGQSHEERMLASLSQVPPFAPLLPEEEYVAWVENSASLDPELARMGAQLWAELPAAAGRVAAAIGRLELPTLIMQSAAAPYSSGPLELSEEPGERPNISVLRFGNTGHVIYRDRFAAFVEQARAFLARV